MKKSKSKKFSYVEEVPEDAAVFGPFGSDVVLKREFPSKKHKVNSIRVPFCMNGYEFDDWLDSLSDAERYFYFKCHKLKQAREKKMKKIMGNIFKKDGKLRELMTQLKHSMRRGD